MRSSVLAVALVLCWGSLEAQAYSYRQGKAARHRGWKQRKREYRVRKAPKKTPTGTRRAAPVRRPMQHATFERMVTTRVHSLRTERIRTLLQIIATTPAKERAGLYFRLAELYWETGRHYAHKAHKYYDYRGRPNWPAYQRKQKQAFVTSKKFKAKAARVYRMIIKGYPSYDRLCEAYYFLGKNLTELGLKTMALQVYRPMMVKFRYPACPFIPDAYLQYGEYYFGSGQVRNALKSYQQVVGFGNSRVYGFALYKIAWCHYNLTEYRDAVKKFVQVINASRRSSAMSLRRRLAWPLNRRTRRSSRHESTCGSTDPSPRSGCRAESPGGSPRPLDRRWQHRARWRHWR